jgi:hypothetical protein
MAAGGDGVSPAVLRTSRRVMKESSGLRPGGHWVVRRGADWPNSHGTEREMDRWLKIQGPASGCWRARQMRAGDDGLRERMRGRKRAPAGPEKGERGLRFEPESPKG